MAHGMELRDLVRVLAFADRRMVACDLLDVAVANLVEPRVTDMSDGGHVILDDHDGEDAGHAGPFRAGGRQAVNLVVGHGDCLTYALPNGSGLALEPLAQHAQRNVGGLAAGRLSADAVDDDEQTARLVGVEAILVDLTLKAGIGGAGSRDGAVRRHPGCRCGALSAATRLRPQPRRER